MSLRIRLLRAALRRPRAALGAAGVALAALGALLAAAAGALGEGEAEANSNPRAVLGRVWYDAYPERRSDEVTAFLWFGGGIGLVDEGSMYRYKFELFEFERRGSELDMTFLQDRSRAETRFSLRFPCEEKPPFDMCLTLDSPVRGKKTLYSFGDEEDFGERVPWGPAFRSAAERAAAAAR